MKRFWIAVTAVLLAMDAIGAIELWWLIAHRPPHAMQAGRLKSPP